jgi:hypothetical protein
VTVLATSRRRLAVAAEHDATVHPLDVEGDQSDALELLIERIGEQALPTVPVERAALVMLAARLDGLPLALELAAGRCRVMAPTAVLERLTDRFRLFGGDRAGRSTLWGTVQWSYDLLGETAKRAAARVSVFAGTFSLEAAETVASNDDIDGYDVDDAIAELVEFGLLDYRDNRYSMLETTREFCLNQLGEAGGVDTFRDRHVGWVIGFLAEASGGLRGRDELIWVDRLDVEWSNVRSAFHRLMNYDDPTLPTRFATLLPPENMFRRPEALGWCVAIYERFKNVSHDRAYDLAAVAGEAMWSLGDPETALDLSEHALALRPPGAPKGDYLPEGALTVALSSVGRPLDALEACRAQSSSDEPFRAIMGDCGEMLMYILAGRPDGGREAAERGIRRAERLGNPSMLAFAKMHGSYTMVNDRRVRTRLAAEAIEHARTVRNRYVELNAQLAWAWGREAGTTAHDVQVALLDVAYQLVRGGWLLQAWAALALLAHELGRAGDNATALLLAYAVGRSPNGPSQSTWLDQRTTRWATAIDAPTATRLARQAEHLDVGDALQLAESAIRVR